MRTFLGVIIAIVALILIAIVLRSIYLMLRGWYAGARAEWAKYNFKFDIVPIIFWTAVICLPGGLLLAWLTDIGYFTLLTAGAVIFFLAGG